MNPNFVTFLMIVVSFVLIVFFRFRVLSQEYEAIKIRVNESSKDQYDAMAHSTFLREHCLFVFFYRVYKSHK